MTGMERRTVDVGGASLEVFLAGSGEPWLCTTHPYGVNGLGLDEGSLTDALARVGRTVVVNPRGAGGSTAGDDPDELTMAQLVADLERVRGALTGGEPWVFAGTSMGGFVGLLYALGQPTALRVLIVNGSAPSWRYIEEPDCGYNPANERGAAMRATLARMREPGAGPEVARDWGRQIMELSIHRRDVLERYLARGSLGISPRRLARVVQEVRGVDANGRPRGTPYDVTDRLDEILVPTLITCGRHDPQCPIHQSELIHAGIRGSRIVTFEDSGHFPFFEEGERYRKAVGTFVREALAPARS